MVGDKLEARIQARRNQEKTGEKPAIQHAMPPPPEESESKPKEKSPELIQAIAAMVAGDNPIKVARFLSACIATGTKQKDLWPQIGKTSSWLSKRLGLLKAPKDIQELIESGKMSESDYNDNPQNLKAGISKRGGKLDYKRIPTVTINIEAAKALASILKKLADQNYLAPIRFNEHSGKKDITIILNHRADEIDRTLK